MNEDDESYESWEIYLGESLEEISNREEKHDEMSCLRIMSSRRDVYIAASDLEFKVQLKKLKKLHSLISRDNAPAVRERSHKGRVVFELTKLGRQVVMACNGQRRDSVKIYKDYEFSPIYRLMLGSTNRWGGTVRRSWDGSRCAQVNAEAALAIEKIVEFVRRYSESDGFKNSLRDIEHEANDNFESACRYIEALFENNSSLLISRLDYYFRPDAKGWGYTEEARHAMHLHIRQMRENPIFDGYIGCINKWENGVSRGMHLHQLVICKGHDHRQAGYLARKLGERWEGRLGKEVGSYFNCYAIRKSYELNGLGLVKLRDREKLWGIRLALWYMTKRDCILRVQTGKRKNFWKSQMPKRCSVRGAPRKDGNDMRHVRAALAGKRSRYPPDVLNIEIIKPIGSWKEA